MSARSLDAWARLGSEAECEDRRIADREGCEQVHPRRILHEVLDDHFDADLSNPDITPDRPSAVDALVRGYREGA